MFTNLFLIWAIFMLACGTIAGVVHVIRTRRFNARVRAAVKASQPYSANHW